MPTSVTPVTERWSLEDPDCWLEEEHPEVASTRRMNTPYSTIYICPTSVTPAPKQPSKIPTTSWRRKNWRVGSACCKNYPLMPINLFRRINLVPVWVCVTTLQGGGACVTALQGGCTYVTGGSISFQSGCACVSVLQGGGFDEGDYDALRKGEWEDEAHDADLENNYGDMPSAALVCFLPLLCNCFVTARPTRRMTPTWKTTMATCRQPPWCASCPIR